MDLMMTLPYNIDRWKIRKQTFTIHSLLLGIPELGCVAAATESAS